MMRRASLGVLLGLVACFADPPPVGSTTSNTSNGSSGGASSEESGTSTSTDPTSMTTNEPTSTVMTTSPDTETGSPGSSGSSTFSEVSTAPSETSAVGVCACGWDPDSLRGDGSAYECVITGAGEPGVPPYDCPMEFAAGDPCMAYPVGLEGCCDFEGNVVWCVDNRVGTMAVGITCADGPPTCD